MDRGPGGCPLEYTFIVLPLVSCLSGVFRSQVRDSSETVLTRRPEYFLSPRYTVTNLRVPHHRQSSLVGSFDYLEKVQDQPFVSLLELPETFITDMTSGEECERLTQGGTLY